MFWRWFFTWTALLYERPLIQDNYYKNVAMYTLTCSIVQSSLEHSMHSRKCFITSTLYNYNIEGHPQNLYNVINLTSRISLYCVVVIAVLILQRGCMNANPWDPALYRHTVRQQLCITYYREGVQTQSHGIQPYRHSKANIHSTSTGLLLTCSPS